MPPKAAQETDKQSKSSPSTHVLIEDMRKTFDDGSIVACQDINLSINEDEFVVFVGPSGCGKTTTLRCIAGLEIPDSGHVEIQGREVTHLKPKDRDVAFVFQDITLFPHMTVRQNIQFGLDMKTSLSGSEKEEKVREVAQMLGIEELLDRQPSALSGGQQQRVSLGRAMVMDPSAFLLDEPFSALDANLRDRMRIEVKKLQQKLNKSMIFVTHDQEEAMTLGDKIVVMNDGRIQQIGSPYEIYNEPANHFVAQFIGSPSTNLMPCTLEAGRDGISISSGFFELELPPDLADQINGYEGRVDLGVRPEHLELGEDGIFEADIQVVEPHGSRDAVYLTAGDRELVAVVDAGVIPQDRDTIQVDMDIDKIWLFKESGERLL
ncbi:ABC transporter ATP-binding protein [Halobellus captivus]|uniref:ABC transporter ATP-binding protein n=1 Tax=Halobellus captivus TaxID=2592614 RepID=UPI0011A6E36A|nr:ABC transporter ATP-binding protein [Halobellus captivus]